MDTSTPNRADVVKLRRDASLALHTGDPLDAIRLARAAAKMETRVAQSRADRLDAIAKQLNF